MSEADEDPQGDGGSMFDNGLGGRDIRGPMGDSLGRFDTFGRLHSPMGRDLGISVSRFGELRSLDGGLLGRVDRFGEVRDVFGGFIGRVSRF
jgi:hypothetical protein